MRPQVYSEELLTQKTAHSISLHTMGGGQGDPDDSTTRMSMFVYIYWWSFMTNAASAANLAPAFNESRTFTFEKSSSLEQATRHIPRLVGWLEHLASQREDVDRAARCQSP